MSDFVRWDVTFSGRVQGVGFRYTTQAVARNFAVVGYVQNLPDGSVLLVAEGTRAEVRRLVDAVQDRMSDNIEDVQIKRSESRTKFASFEIRH